MAGDEHLDVVIIGAGPAGLVLAIALAHYKIKTLIIEKNTEICEDPRAIAMAGDTTRILEVLGVTQAQMAQISQILNAVHFHTGTFTSAPFLSMSLEPDLEQVLPSGIVLLQPGLEQVLRGMVDESEYAELRLGCEGLSIEEVGETVRVDYRSCDGSRRQVSSRFLVGADGKRGFVRKGYLEAKDIRQVVGVYPYEATWVVANLHISLPTPESHPDFPLWKAGYTPEELWDIFWPDGFHFCRHPEMPVATGRFGPAYGRYWRFEYELPPDFQCSDEASHLMEMLRPHLIIPGSRFSRNGMRIDQAIQFPEDCIHVLRCGQASFNNRVVNRWFHNRIILIGDAAHVFPPFGAQGMASGIRDAFGLSWRISVLLHEVSGLSTQEKSYRHKLLLDSWARERRSGVDDSSRRTEANGSLLLGKSKLAAAAIGIANGVLAWIPSLRERLIQKRESDSQGFGGVEGGFFIDGLAGLGDCDDEAGGGGGKTAQVYVKAAGKESLPMLSDRLFWRTRCSLTVLLLRQTSDHEVSEVRKAIEAADLRAPFLAGEILELVGTEANALTFERPSSSTTLRITPAKAGDPSGPPLLENYDPCVFRKRFQPGALCALVRPDFIIFSQAHTLAQLQQQLSIAAKVLLTGTVDSTSRNASV